VLNDRGGVAPEKEARVLSAARRLKVDRNLNRRYARVLRIAVLIQSAANPFHEALRAGFASASRAYADLSLQFLIQHILPGDAGGIAATVRGAMDRHDGSSSQALTTRAFPLRSDRRRSGCRSLRSPLTFLAADDGPTSVRTIARAGASPAI
jgi:hypothetical protein